MANDANVKLEVRGIEKSFPGVKALDNVTFRIKKGSVHVLCGENGAGKSTLMKIINGIYQPDAGEIFVDGKKVTIANPIQARSYGISMIFQELNYIPEMTVEQTLFLGKEPLNKIKGVDWKRIRKETLELLAREDLPYKPDTKLKDLSVSDIQMLEILKAVSEDADMIIMDEPTSAITNKEVENLFKKIYALRDKGVAMVYISHKMDEIFRIADEITVLRDGSVIDTKAKDETNIDEVIKKMVGREMTNVYPKETCPIGEVKLEVRNFDVDRKIKGVNFQVRAGEIIGFAGLMGAGRTETVRAIFGLDHYESGEVLVDGKAVKIRNVQDAINNGIAMLSEDRRRFGLIAVRSVKENASLSSLKQFIYSGFLHKRKEKKYVSDMFERMRVKTPTLDTPIGNLSGGNQQKVILAKWLLASPEILIMDEPTRGIDVGAKYGIYELMMELAKQGKALVVISSELPELIGMCDRVYVMAEGRVTGEIDTDSMSQESIMKLATKG